MKDESKDTLKQVEDNMACSAFAEAGEPCPIDTGSGPVQGEAEPGKGHQTLEAVEKDFACTAFHDQNMNCPLDNDKK